VNKVFIISTAKPIELFMELRRRLWPAISFWSSFDDRSSSLKVERWWVPKTILLSLSWITPPCLEVLRFGMSITSSFSVSVAALSNGALLLHGGALYFLDFSSFNSFLTSLLAGFTCSSL